ncbi:hypothetical protein ALC57_07848 [Trachymyrmex cornetzi]|uniref:Uncharacterized protein n=1 Tax=Trachymyrmex cornetzi TaxID=471704 RepID=A0A195E3T0_9HYME|nr:hypothetical protein ALC57_07848 [Trachymyrmex cornetzi]
MFRLKLVKEWSATRLFVMCLQFFLRVSSPELQFSSYGSPYIQLIVIAILMARSFSDKYLAIATIGKMMEAIPAIGRNRTMPTNARAPLIKPYHVAP